MKLEVLRCPRHVGFYAVAVNDTRVTPSKCCGEWSAIARWKIDARSWAARIRRALVRDDG